MKTALFTILFLSTSIPAFGATCVRDESKLADDEIDYLHMADKAQGTYQTKGENCGELKVTVKENCDDGVYESTRVEVDLGVNDRPSEDIGIHFTLPMDYSSTGVRYPYFSSWKRSMKMSQSYSSQGGFGTYADAVSLKFNRKGKLKSINAKEKFGMIFQWTYLEMDCKIIY